MEACKSIAALCEMCPCMQDMDALQQHRIQLAEQLQTKGGSMQQQQKGVCTFVLASVMGEQHACTHDVQLNPEAWPVCRAEGPQLHADGGADRCQHSRETGAGCSLAPYIPACTCARLLCGNDAQDSAIVASRCLLQARSWGLSRHKVIAFLLQMGSWRRQASG